MRVVFDTRDKKPKIWNVAVISAVLVAVVAVLVLIWGDGCITAVSIIMDLYLIAVIVLLIRAFFMQLEYNPYSYNVVYYLGFSLFVFFVLIFNVLSTFRVFSDPSSMNITQLLRYLCGASRNYLIMTSVIIVPFCIILAVSNVFLIKHDGFRVVNLLGIFLGIFLIGGLAFMLLYNHYFDGNVVQLRRHELVMSLVSSLYLYFECMLAGAIAAGLIAALHEPEPNKDIVLILGCDVGPDGSPSPVLQARIDRAIAFREKQLSQTGKDLRFITTGGKGTDERPSESRCMHDYLIAKDVPEEVIIQEDQSTTTHENMIFSKKKIAETDPGARVAFSTSGFHVFRSGLYARREKIRAVGMGAQSKWYYWPNASVREFAGILSEHRIKQALILLGIIAVNVLLLLLVYMI